MGITFKVFCSSHSPSIYSIEWPRGIDVVFTKDSKFDTLDAVCLGDKQCFFRMVGAASTMMIPETLVYLVNHLVGCQPDCKPHRDVKPCPFVVNRGPDDGYPLWHLGEVKTFTASEVLRLVFSKLKCIAEKNLNCCIEILVYFDDLQGRGLSDAVANGDLNYETSVAHGICGIKLPENYQLNVAVFFDINGRANSMKVCVPFCKKVQLKILAHSLFWSLDGRDLDEVFIQHFGSKFKMKYKIDVLHSAKACPQHWAVSENPEAPMNTGCLIDGREEIKQSSVPVWKPVKRPLEKAYPEPALTYESVHRVEVERGCALQSALLSPIFKHHRRPLYFNKARFFYLILFLLLQSTPTEARGDSDDSPVSYLSIMAIAFIIAIGIIIMIGILCNCTRRFTGKQPGSVAPEHS